MADEPGYFDLPAGLPPVPMQTLVRRYSTDRGSR